jgi:hypothetical protein
MWRGLLVLAGGLALAGCATYGAPGGYGGYGYPGGQGAYGGNPYGNPYAEAVEGTVVGVDRGYQRIVIDRGGYGGRGGQVAIRYDRRTALTYRGRQYPVEGLERGDVVRVEGAASGGQLHARHIVVLRNVRESGYGYGYPGGGYGADPYHPGDPAQGYAEFRGRVEFVDPRARVIRIQGGGYGRGGDVRYSPNATVRWQGDNYPASNLDPGDIIRVQARRSGNAWYAERLWLESNRGR